MWLFYSDEGMIVCRSAIADWPCVVQCGPETVATLMYLDLAAIFELLQLR